MAEIGGNANFEHEFIARTGRIAKQWGIGEPAGKIWGLLALQNKPLTQKEIAKGINASLSLVSPALTLMEHLGIASTVAQGGREKKYIITLSFIDTFEKLLKNFCDNEVKPLLTILHENMHTGNLDKKERIRMLIKEYERTAKTLKIFSKVLMAQRSLRKFKLLG